MFAVVIAFLVTAGWSANHFAAVLILLREQEISPLLIDGAFGIYALGLFPTLILGGVIADKVGSRPAVVAGTLISGLGNLILMFWHDNAVLLAGRFIVGVGVGLVVSAGTAWAGKLRGVAGTTLAGIALTCGFMLGPVGSGIVAHFVPGAIWVPFVVPVGMAVGVTVASLSMREKTPIFSAPPVTSGNTERSVRKALATAVPIGMWVFGSITCAIVILAGRAQFAINTVFMPGAAAVIGFGVALVIQAIARRREFGPRSGVMGILSSAAGMSLVAAGGLKPSMGLFVVATVLLGLGYGLCLREGLLDVEAFAPAEARGRVIGIYYVFAYLGFTLPPLNVWLIPRVGPSVLYVVLASGAVCAAAVRAWQIRSGYLVRR